MSRAIDLLDEALDLARKEKSALEDGEYDEAMGLAAALCVTVMLLWL